MQAMHEHAKPCGWTLLSLRPQGQHAVLRAAAAALGGDFIALSPWRLRARTDAGSRDRFVAAIQSDIVVFTSPAAVAAARALGLGAATTRAGCWLAVGEGTRRALRAAGFDDAQAPTREDSEGLLALPALAGVAGQRIGLVTAPGGRGVLAAALQARGACVLRADVYERVPVPISRRTLARMSASPRPWLLAVSSGEALQRSWEQLSLRQQCDWQAHVQVIAASERLMAQAGALGLRAGALAAGPSPAQLAAACAERVTGVHAALPARDLPSRARSDDAVGHPARPA